MQTKTIQGGSKEATGADGEIVMEGGSKEMTETTQPDISRPDIPTPTWIWGFGLFLVVVIIILEMRKK